MKLTSGQSGWLALLAVLAAFAPTNSSSGATYTWVGSGGNGNWFSSSGPPYSSANFNPSSGIASSGTNTFIFNNSSNLSTTVNTTSGFSLGTLTFGNSAGAFTVDPNNGLTFAPNTLNSSALNNSSANTQTFTNGGTVTFAGTVNNTMTINNSSGIVFQGPVVSNATTLTKTGVGTVTFNGDLSGASNLNVTQGTVVLTSGSLNSLSTSAAGSVTQNGAFVFGPGASTLSGTYTATSGATTFTGPVTVQGGNQAFISGTFQGGLTVQGGGTASGVADGGAVSLTGGSIDFLDGGTATSLILASGAFNINGVNTGTVTNSGDTTFGNNFDINFSVNQNGSHDLLNTVGLLDYGGANLNISLTNTGTLTNGQSWDMFNFGSYTGDLNSVTLTGNSPYNSLFTFQLATSGNVYDQKYGGQVWLSNWLTGTDAKGYDSQRFMFDQKTGILTVVPEPSTIVFAGIGAAMLGWQTWAGRRRKARMKLVEEHTRTLSAKRGLA